MTGWLRFSDFEALPTPEEIHESWRKQQETKIHESWETKKKTTLPPTEKQLERINELKDLPEFQEHLDWLLTAIEKGMLNTRGQAGILINQMKKKCGLI